MGLLFIGRFPSPLNTLPLPRFGGGGEVIEKSEFLFFVVGCWLTRLKANKETSKLSEKYACHSEDFLFIAISLSAITIDDT